MEMLKNTTFYNSDVNVFRNQIAALIEEVYPEALEMALSSFRLMGLVSFETIAANLQSFSYTPKMRSYLMSEDADDFICNDDDTPVRTAMGKPYRGETSNLSKRLELCMVTCEGKMLRDEVLKEVAAVLKVLMFKMYRMFWFGRPDRGIFGILNHPEAAKNAIESPFLWSSATDNQIAMQLVKAMKHMTNPKVIIAENIYNSSVGLSREGEAVSCSMRMDCIRGIITAQSSINIQGELRMESNEDLNANSQHGDLVIVYDADGVYMTRAEPVLMAPIVKDSQNVTAKILMNTAGLHIEYHDSIRVIEGAGAPIKE